MPAWLLSPPHPFIKAFFFGRYQKLRICGRLWPIFEAIDCEHDVKLEERKLALMKNIDIVDNNNRTEVKSHVALEMIV